MHKRIHIVEDALRLAAREGRIRSAQELGVDQETWTRAGGDPLDGTGIKTLGHKVAPMDVFRRAKQLPGLTRK